MYPQGPLGEARTPHFWLDGGYDFELVRGCRLHPSHGWITVGVHHGGLPSEPLTICRVCGVPRCGTTGDADRCTLWRHHETEHVHESGRLEPVGGVG